MTYNNNDFENNNSSYSENGFQQEEQNTMNEPNSVYATYRQAEKKEKKSSFLTKKAAVALFVLCIGTSSVLGFGGGYLAGNQNTDTSSVQSQNVSADGTESDSQLTKLSNTSTNGSSLSVAEIAAKAQDSVVEIKTEAIQTGSFMSQYVSEGAGSGVIISSDGYIVTNNHVIEDAQNITVTLRDGTSYTGTLVGTDSKTDVAIIKIDATGLQAAEIGDSSTLEVGDVAVAIGNPLGELGGTVTDGIISALDREITLGDETMNLLQTNAAINPGNSGGGLFNDQGQLIGIVVAKSSGTDVEGLGFAIPINNVKDVISDLQTYGYVTGRPVLGIETLEITDIRTAMTYGVSQPGVYVYNVENTASGLQSGDLIQSVNGTEITSASQLKSIIESCSVGDNITISVLRNGQQVELTIKLLEDQPVSSNSSNV